MVKVLYKFGDGKLSLKKLEERLGWDGHEVIRVAEKAQENGYVRFATSKKGKLSVALTDKGTMVVEKRLAAEDRAADEVLEGLTDKERECLLKLTGKVIENCKAMGRRLSHHRRQGLPRPQARPPSPPRLLPTLGNWWNGGKSERLAAFHPD